MDNATYTALIRQSGFLAQMETIANNIANLSTTGFRREGVLFSEYVQQLDGVEPALSMATANVRTPDLSQGVLNRTGGQFDLAIQGEGFFQTGGTEGPRLTRAGAFTRDPEGRLVTPGGAPLLDTGGSPILVPPEATVVSVGADGTVSADGNPVAQIGLFAPVDPNDLRHRAGTTFSATAGVQPAQGPGQILQGYLEGSNVNAVTEVARMIEVQRAYEMSQSFLDNEDQRMRSVIQTLGK